MSAAPTGAVLFDLDGLLIDSEPLWQTAEIEVFGAHGLNLTNADCAATAGLRIDEAVGHWLDVDPMGGVAAETLVAAILDRMVELIGSRGEALPGAATAVAWAGALPATAVGLVTSSVPRIVEAAVDRLGLHDAFDAVVSADGEPYGKPHPAVYLRAADRLAVDPVRCLAVEDTVAGLVAAKAARMTCVVVPNGTPADHGGFGLADGVLASLADLPAWGEAWVPFPHRA